MDDKEIRKELKSLYGRLKELEAELITKRLDLQKETRRVQAQCPHNDKRFCYGGQYERNYYHCRVCGLDIDE